MPFNSASLVGANDRALNVPNREIWLLYQDPNRQPVAFTTSSNLVNWTATTLSYGFGKRVQVAGPALPASLTSQAFYYLVSGSQGQARLATDQSGQSLVTIPDGTTGTLFDMAISEDDRYEALISYRLPQFPSAQQVTFGASTFDSVLDAAVSVATTAEFANTSATETIVATHALLSLWSTAPSSASSCWALEPLLGQGTIAPSTVLSVVFRHLAKAAP